MAGGIFCPTCAVNKIPHLGCLTSADNDRTSISS